MKLEAKNYDLNLLNLNDYWLEVGIFSSQTSRDGGGVTNAEILFINEYGSPLRHIPSRPVLKYAIEWGYEQLQDHVYEDLIKAYVKSGLDKLVLERKIKQFAMRLQNYARNIIIDKDGRLAPNSPSTIKKKGENYPLHDTGQLARSIQCRAMYKDREL